jgi:4-hydroxy-4-methyl-2-oxoglutarate aldolase
MDTAVLQDRFARLTTAHVADGCLRADVPVRCGPTGLQAVVPGTRAAGRVAPARHAGSVDVFLEAFERAAPGDVLVVDNGGRLDESCVGDLITLEAQAAGFAGLVIWGLHRDTALIQRIGLPVFSLGRIPTGPVETKRNDPASRTPQTVSPAEVGEWTVDADDVVLADDDGVLFVPADRAEQLLATAHEIWRTEREQARRIRGGDTLRDQTRFADYLQRRAEDPSYTFRQHLRRVGGAIEE